MIRRRAFTLVEMMVALSITGVLTVMMMQMFSDSSTIWKTEDDRLDTFREARAALQLMSRDFASALPLPQATGPGITDNYPVLALRSTQQEVLQGHTPQPRTTPNTTPNTTQYYPAAYLLAAAPNTGRGDLCAIGFFLDWEPSIKSSATTSPSSTPAPTPTPRTVFALRRQIAQSDTTFARLRETLPLVPKPPFFGASTFDVLYATIAPKASVNGTTLPNPVTETIATYIWDLEFAVSKEPPATATPTPSPSSPAPAATPAPGQKGFYGTKLPSWVEIRFKALGSTAARKLSGNPLVTEELWSKPKDPAYIRLILPAEQQFVSRVKLAR